MQFEELIKELEEIVGKLDAPGCQLDEGIGLFNRGIAVSKECLAVLNANKGKVALLKKELDGILKEDFDPLAE